MTKSVLKEKYLNELLERVQSIQPEQLPLWGKMNIVEMLMHCTQVTAAVLDSPKSSHPTTWKQHIAKFIFLYLKKEFPKLVKGPKRFDAKGKVQAEEFILWKQNFTETLEKFKNLEKPLSGYHPFFGKLNHKEWGIMLYKHTHHHLKQFGL